VDKVTLEQVFSQYFGLPCQFSFHRLLHIHHHLSSGVGTMGQLVADVPRGLSLTPPHETKKKTKVTILKPDEFRPRLTSSLIKPIALACPPYACTEARYCLSMRKLVGRVKCVTQQGKLEWAAVLTRSATEEKLFGVGWPSCWLWRF
jgi:hypothetical protein